jgi:putative DNA modification/repair radical SAM protein
MDADRIKEKLAILADSAKYDVSCSSSGGKRKNANGGLGNSEGMGICHSFTEDGRCVSLLKILLTNFCIYDCAYCVTRRSNDVKRVAFTVAEVVELTMSFYRRNYIEGLFLSSGIFKDPDTTMERLVRVTRELRVNHHFNGYIHLKTIPGASEELIAEAGRWADRLSVNIELPSEASLQSLAPEKNYHDIELPMELIRDQAQAAREEGKIRKSAPRFAPAGQSTQLIIGASPETDQQILTLSDKLYRSFSLKRVYYSGYVPIRESGPLAVVEAPPVLREHRLYQSDWLMRYYGFDAQEITTPEAPNLPLDIDPKLAWGLRNRDLFPVDVNAADYELLLRVPGIGVRSAQRIVAARRTIRLTVEHLKKLGVVLRRARYFLVADGPVPFTDRLIGELDSVTLKRRLLVQDSGARRALKQSQLSLF